MSAVGGHSVDPTMSGPTLVRTLPQQLIQGTVGSLVRTLPQQLIQGTYCRETKVSQMPLKAALSCSRRLPTLTIPSFTGYREPTVLLYEPSLFKLVVDKGGGVRGNLGSPELVPRKIDLL